MTNAEPPSAHVGEDLPGLLLGDFGRDDTRRVSTHLRGCSECRAELVDAAVAFGSLAASNRTLAGASDRPRPAAGPDSPEVQDPLPPLRPARAHWDRRRPVLAAVAAAATLVVVAAAVSIGHLGKGGNTHTSKLASAALQPLSAPPAARGEVTLSRSGTDALLEIRTSGLPSPGPGRFYEAWLLDPATNKMMAMGVLPPAGRTTFTVYGNLVQGYTSVDISLQANNGDPGHSTTSVLRANDL